MSRPIATFANQSLASSQVFQVDVVECWQLKKNEEDESAGAGASGNASKRVGGGSVLDRAQDRNFLSLGNINVNHSDGLRVEAPIEE